MLFSTQRLLPPLLLASLAASYPYIHPLSKRSFITADEVQDSYDFVIVGGGLAGLVLAGRLSENSTTQILVLEAGGNGDDVRERIDRPGLAYYNGILFKPDHDWLFQTEPQNMLNSRQITWPMGKVVGGSSAGNGMYLVRPSSVEVDTWHNWVKDLDGADSWTSTSFFNAMKKSETFTPPLDEIRDQANIKFDAASHGSQGPLHATYPAYEPPVAGSWIGALGGQGIAPSPDPYNGEAWGAFFSTSAINPTNWTRSYSRSAYIDPYYRPNLHILTDNEVSKVVFDGTKAVGVIYGQGLKQVGVTKEVILSAGAVNSPATLLRSGVGPKDILDSAGVQTIVNLPGVGQHLQDHLATGIIYKTTSETAATVYNDASDARATTPEFLSYVNSAIAYINTAELIADPTTFSNEIMANLSTAVTTLVPSQDESVLNGYKEVNTQYGTTLLQSKAGQIELLLATTGSSAGADSIQIQVALQRPFSHGHLWINSTDPFAHAVIDPGYFSHPADIVMLREGIKLARRIGNTDPLKEFLTEEVAPGTAVQTDADIENFLRGDVHTEFHPSCTCSMLPKEMGGVVDAKLRVYGTSNLRVVDASVFPLEWSAHMMAPTYGLAEKAAEIIAATYSSSASVIQNGDSNSNNNNGNNGNNNKGAAGRLMVSPVLAVATVALGAVLAAF